MSKSEKLSIEKSVPGRRGVRFAAASRPAAAWLAGTGAVFFPILFYRSSRSWWLMNYYLVMPGHLPANQRPVAEDEDSNT